MEASENKKLSKEEIKEIIKKKKNSIKELEKNAEYIKQLSDIAILQFQIEEYGAAEKNLLTCLTHFDNQKDRLGKASAMGLLGTLYFKKGDYNSSIDFYKKAFDIYDELKQINEKIMSLKGLGNAYLKSEQFEIASDIFFECCEICSENNEIYSFLDCIGHLITIYESQKEWDIVNDLYEKALEAFQKIDDKKGIITSYFNLGILNKNNQKYQNALFFFKKGVNTAIDANYSEHILKGLSYVAETLYYLGEMNQAKNQYIRALDLAEKIGAENAIRQIEILLRSFGLSDTMIEEEKRKYQQKT
jgi:tetratricopeptide (TPR) repeat protein